MQTYPLAVASLADITRDALVGTNVRDFAKAAHIGVSTVNQLVKGLRVRQQTVERLAAYLPERASEIRAAAEGFVLPHTTKKPRVRHRSANRSLVQTESWEGAAVLLPPYDPVKRAIAQIVNDLSDQGCLEALTAMGEIAQRDRKRAAPQGKTTA